MNIFILEFYRLKKSIKKIVFIVLLLHLINTLIFIRNINGMAGSNHDFFTLLFSSSYATLMNWMYWLSFCVGYMILLQILWKSPEYMYEVQMILRLRQWKNLWMARFIIGILFTLYYVFSALSTAIILFCVFHVHIEFDMSWLMMFLCITINLLLHGTMWLVMKNHVGFEVATISVLGIFFIGLRSDSPFTPLYYGMYENIQGSFGVVLLELIIIFSLMIYVIHHATKNDYL
ncbi:hypothetical protein [Bacillus sp. 179-C3.3 HS]|uniref:hypothetical protein n=1 Tax=Bacillus sp. 179-C3.3 HS TaxID=3232162 RepID=UPI0039A33D91